MLARTGFLAAISAAASGCAPVPQSKMRSSPPAVVSSTHDVLPPKWFVPGPGVAIEPRVPQKRILMNLRLLQVRRQSREIAFRRTRMAPSAALRADQEDARLARARAS